ncbi:bifunctional choline kinase/ethanolamine kinase EKI1 NDAI_0J00980 [Naumovozyma dairenensis CBS 421]|uniref:Choline kinase N-terminal domain-containing protein n=1 Tax=Naumovozyma dairenensis (strain ATCC 10597 / BCRC 20456 / CBS 421 / NBRC 0211 / NRRL Y-12639) TaxID=1071378 RepID=G0WGR2_NAUDC|nr:hypothetical protein NDAI_0J00980 [Naumovozyma dairenensis CBS 421]CCD26990.1 hypothetical protein NDAI_0J00980 [Naumovozyma dairenensis CBS 421]
MDNANTTINDTTKIPFVNETIDIATTSDLREHILHLIHRLQIPNWYGTIASTEQFQIYKLKGALTNVIYRLESPLLLSDDVTTIPSLLLRIYGDQDDSSVDREYELKSLQKLHDVGMRGPIILGIFNNGRIESFFDGFHSLEREEIRDMSISRSIAMALKELHVKIQLDGESVRGQPDCWLKINKWIHTIGRQLEQFSMGNDVVEKLLLCPKWEFFNTSIHKYREWLQKQESKYEGGSLPLLHLKFCHNDLQQGNILHNYRKRQETNKDDVILIDYEYAGPNPISFDISNHLTEWVHDYNNQEDPAKCVGEKYPTTLELQNFLSTYLNHLSSTTNDDNDADLVRLHNSIIRWRPCTQLFWSVWAILQGGALLVDKNAHTQGHSDDGDKFDYNRFCQEKMSYFWGDLIKFGIVNKNDLEKYDIRYIESEFLPETYIKS